MAYSMRSSLLAWWLLLIIAVFLWYRNDKYDRTFSGIAVVVAMIQLIEYGVYNNMNPKQGGKMIYIVLWLISFIFALAVLVTIRTTYSLIWFILVSIVFLFAASYVFLSKKDDKFTIRKDDGYLIYKFEGAWLFIISIFMSLLLLMSRYDWKDIGLYLVFFYLLISAIIINHCLGWERFPSIWCYSFVGIVFIVWLSGMFYP